METSLVPFIDYEPLNKNTAPYRLFHPMAARVSTENNDFDTFNAHLFVNTSLLFPFMLWIDRFL